MLRLVFWFLRLLDGRQQALRSKACGLSAPALSGRPWLLDQGSRAVVLVSALLPPAVGAALVRDDDVVVAVAVLSPPLTLDVAPPLLAHLRLTRGHRRLRVAPQVVLRHEPPVILRSANPPGGTCCITARLSTRGHLPRRSAVVLHDPGILDLLPKISLSAAACRAAPTSAPSSCRRRRRRCSSGTVPRAAHTCIAEVSGSLSALPASDRLCLVVNTTGAPDELFRPANASTCGPSLRGPGGAGLLAAPDDAKEPDAVRERRRATPSQTSGRATDDPRPPSVDAVDALATTLRTFPSPA